MSKLQYTPLQILKQQRTAVTQTAEFKHWKQFKTEYNATSKNAISTVASSLNQLNHIFFSSGRELSIYSPTSKQLLKTHSTFTDNISTMSIRNDGLLFAVGLESGRIQVMDVKNMLSLRVFTNHFKRINALEYANVNELYSAGDDKIIRQFDIAANAVVHSFPNAHEDYIRCLGYLGDNHIISGSYDNTIKIFDFRVHKQKVMKFNHGLPVESLAVMPNKLSFASVGGTALKVWDVRTNKLSFQNLNNKKTLTTVKITGDGDRILSGGLDQQLKIYSTTTLELTYQQKYEDSISSFDITADSKHLAVGLNNGNISVKGLNKEIVEESSDDEGKLPSAWRLEQKESTAYNNSYFYRGIYSNPTDYDETNFRQVQTYNNKSGFYDKCLKKFEYKKALVSSITKNQMHILHSLVEQFKQRGVLERTLKHLFEDELRILLKLLTKRINNPKYRDVIFELVRIAYDLHSKTHASITEWEQLLVALDKQIEVEVELSEQLGMLETISSITLP